MCITSKTIIYSHTLYKTNFEIKNNTFLKVEYSKSNKSIQN